MNFHDIQRARNLYNYVPARLVSAQNGELKSEMWGSFHVRPEVPADWYTNSARRTEFSSVLLDKYHARLLNSEVDDEILFGVLSVKFWGTASGTNARITESLALTRTRFVICGNGRTSPQPQNEIVAYLRDARALMDQNRIGDALAVALKIKYFGMAFATKLLAFINPSAAAVYDDVISQRLKISADPELQSLHVDTTKSNIHQQAEAYSGWCRWCQTKAQNLNDQQIEWQDWDGTSHPWRALDVERAFFALGR